MRPLRSWRDLDLSQFPPPFVYGGASINKEESEALKLHPKMAVYPNIVPRDFKLELQKQRWNLMGEDKPLNDPDRPFDDRGCPKQVGPWSLWLTSSTRELRT